MRVLIGLRLAGLGIIGVMLLAGGLSGCGSEASDKGQRAESRKATATGAGASTPAEAVTEFVRVAGSAGAGRDQTRKRLKDACALLSSDIRAGMQFQRSAQDSAANCAAALSLALYYAGDNGELPQPSSFTVTVDKVGVRGRQATVAVRVTYETDKGPRSYPSKVLAVRAKRGWAVATPQTLGILTASAGVDDAQLAQSYHELTRTADASERKFEEGRKASSRVSDDIESCPSEGGSQRSDARGDGRYNDGMRADTATPPASADLTGVRHNGDGGDLCFEVTYAAAAPKKGAVQVQLRPSGGELNVSWDINSKVLGQRRDPGSEEISAVPVELAREGDRVVLRFAKAALGQRGGRYRWALQSFIPTPDGSNAYADSVPQDLSIDPDNGDEYVRQG